MFFAKWCAFFFLAGLNLLGYSEIFFDKKFFKSCPFHFFAKTVARGNAVQIMLDFPAKRLSIYREENFSVTFY